VGDGSGRHTGEGMARNEESPAEPRRVPAESPDGQNPDGEKTGTPVADDVRRTRRSPNAGVPPDRLCE
jgi:hypothetical protein